MTMTGEDIPDEEIRAVMLKHGIADDGGLPLFEFVVNPKSFGQTVENLFYVSFLIKDGNAGFGNDSNMLPTLRKYTTVHYLKTKLTQCSKMRLNHGHRRKFNTIISRNTKPFSISITRHGRTSSKPSTSRRASFHTVSQMRLLKSVLQAGMDKACLSSFEISVVTQKLRYCIYSRSSRS